jgi:hypothetical protein
MVELYLIGSIAMTVIAVISIFYGLKDAHVVRRWPLIIGFGLLLIVCLWTALISTQVWRDVYTDIAGFFVSIVVIIAGFVMLVLLPKWRKTVVLIVSIMFPLLFWQSILTGAENSFDTLTRKNGVLIVQALKAYHVDNHAYPATLEELAPMYMVAVPDDPQSPGGWLYRLTSDDFELGYVLGVDKRGYSVCILTPTLKDWACPSATYDDDHFGLGPTPVPTRTRMPKQ